MKNFTLPQWVGLLFFCILLIPLQSSSQVQIDLSTFETGNAWGIWNDGGVDCFRLGGSPIDGTVSVNLQDNSGVDSSMTTDDLDLTSYSQVDIQFDYHAIGFGNNHDFWVLYSDDGGSSWQNIATYVKPADFVNLVTYNTTVSIDTGSYTFSTNSQFRIQADANKDNNDVKIDNVYIWGHPLEPEMNVQGNLTTIVDGDTTPSVLDDTDWGNVNSGTPTPHTFTIQNNGGFNLNLTGSSPYVVVSGTHAADFTVTAIPSTPITGGSSTTFTITFNPGGAGLRTASLSIANNDSDENPYNFNIQGTGVIPATEMDVSGLGTSIPDNDVTPSTTDDTDWGNINVGTPVQHTFTISSTGTLPLNLTGSSPYVVISGANAADFAVTAIPAPIIAAGGSTTFSITFTPGATGLRSAMVSIANDDSDENPYNFNIQGTGYVVSPEIDITGLGISILDGDTTPSLTDDTDFGSSDIGVPVAHTFTILNTGASILNVGAITFSGANPADFVVTTPPAATVAISGSTTFTVTFTPSAAGAHSATISIVNDDLGENPYNFDLIGQGNYPPPQYTFYYETFDKNNGGWTLITSNKDSWTWTDSFPTNELGEGGFWRNTNFNDYPNDADIVIESPSLDFTGLQNLQLTVDVKYKVQDNTDGMIIQYSVAGGAYATLGASGNGVNWYEDNATVFGTDAFNGDGHVATPTFHPHSQFTNARIQLSDAIFANQSNVKFRIQFTSDSSGVDDGVAFDNFRIMCDPTSSLSDASIAPANITSNLRLWLKMNAGVAVSNGSALTNWEDQAYDTVLDKEDAYTISSLAPTYRDSGTRNINYNPVADFDHNNTEYMSGKGGFYAQDYFVAVRSDDDVDTQTGPLSPGRQFAIGGRFDEKSFHEDPTGLGLGSTSGRFSNEIISHNVDSYPIADPPDEDSWGRAYTSSSDSHNKVLIINVKTNSAGTSTEIYKNGKRVDNATGTSGDGQFLNFVEFENLPYLVGMGRSGITGRTTSQLNGMLGEIISYDTPNSSLNQQKIQSYLGIKYGTTLQASGSSLTDYRLNDVDYIDSQGTVIWDTSVNNGHNYDIAGIGRDDASELNQKQSLSQNFETDGTGFTSGFLTMGLTQIYDTNNENINNNATNLNDREFLVWGNNNASLDGSAINVIVDMSEDIGDASLETNVSFTAIPRIWKVVETGGDIPSVQVSIPTNVVRTATPPNGRYLMFISNSGVFDPTAGYRVMTESGGYLYADYDFDGTEYITFGWAPELEFVRSIYFDPSNFDYVDVEDHLDLNPAGFTISAWVNRSTNSNNKAILSKRDAAYTEGYDFRINNSGYFNARWRNSSGSNQALTSSVQIPQDEWHHLAVIYDGTTATLYIDGVADISGNRSAPTDTSQSFFIGAAGKNSPTAFFHGNIDEVRVWDIDLTEDQLRYIMNQEIEDNATLAVGTYFFNRGISPTRDDISTLQWSKLAGYYPMSVYTYTNTRDESGNDHQGALKNLKTVDWQTAPLPYYSTQNGDWDSNSTWLNGNVQTIPGTKSLLNNNTTIDWNIVQTNHDITIDDDSDLPGANGGNRSVLALLVDSNDILIDGDTAANTGFGLTVTHYLNLDGDMDLEGESQLVQSLNSDLAVTSAGKIERDQQGTADVHTYNYWSSPVGVSNITTNNNSYTLPDVMRDGTQNINFITSGYDGTDTNPIGIADYWIWKFANQLDDDYSSWQHVRSTGTMLAGEGYTMKGPGSGVVLDDQNYVFIGKPNNGDINLPISAGNDYLVGNPYASAIDAQQFILDNAPIIEGTGATTGTLYFWEHWGGGSHNLAEYLGGYATYNLSGGTPSAAQGTNDPDVGTGGTPTKTPGRYIPVSQGFFVIGENTGTINFNNGQRQFKKESVTSVFMDPYNGGNNPDGIGRASNAGVGDPRLKLRIALNSVNELRRQLLVTVDENATEGMDLGYDGVLYEDQLDDLYWLIDDEKYIIQGTNLIDMQTVLPLGIHTDTDGMNSIVLDEMLNTPSDLEIYVHDKELDLYHDLQLGAYEFYMVAGENLERFEIVFSGDQLGIDDEELNGVNIHYSNDIESIVLINPTFKEIKSIAMINMLGQTIYSVDTNNSSDYAEYKVSNLSTGTYILQINTVHGKISKKVLVK
jgi:hypothetical protein